MKKNKWNIILIVTLFLATITVYFLQIWIFKKTEDTFFYLFQDLAFLPLQVLLVTLIINEFLKKREKRSMLNKMNMAVGVYFSEMGNELLKHFSSFDLQSKNIQSLFTKKLEWNARFFSKIKKTIMVYDFKIDIQKGDLANLKTFLISKRGFLISLLGNANLMEHGSFTDLLWAVSHLTEELWFRKNLTHLTQNDADHIANDLKRAYISSLSEWISYLMHLKDHYPYIFSLYTRTNPFDRYVQIEFE